MARKRRSGGLGIVDEAASRKSGAEWLRLDDGDVEIVRVLDVDSKWKDGYVHRVQMTKRDGDEFYTDVMCLDQKNKGIPCPGCHDDLRRSYKFWTNAIVRGDEDSDDPAKQQDRLVIWSGGITIAKQLNKLHGKHSLRDRDVEVERSGKGKNDTSYDIDWYDDEDNELTDEDLALAQKPHDITRYTKIPDYDDFYTNPMDRDRDDDDDDRGEQSVRRGSAFKNRKKKDDEEEEDGGGRRTAARRRSSSSSSSTRSSRSSSRTSSKKSGNLSSFGGKKKAADDKPAAKTTVRRRRPSR